LLRVANRKRHKRERLVAVTLAQSMLHQAVK
jgi:hypothetical protein